jgi:hypothetical protein
MKKQLLASVCWQPGPWARYQNTFTTLIKDLGYAPGSIQNQTQLINRFAEWLRRRQTETKIHCLDETMVQRFLRSQQNPSSVRRGDTATLHRFLYVLRQQGVVPPPKKTPLSPRQRLIIAFLGSFLSADDTAGDTDSGSSASPAQEQTRLQQRTSATTPGSEPIFQTACSMVDATGFLDRWCVRGADQRNVTYLLDPRSRIN